MSYEYEKDGAEMDRRSFAVLLGGGTLLVPKTVHGRVTVAVAS